MGHEGTHTSLNALGGTLLSGWHSLAAPQAADSSGSMLPSTTESNVTDWLRLMLQPHVAMFERGRHDSPHDASPRLISELDRYLTSESSFREKVRSTMQAWCISMAPSWYVVAAKQPWFHETPWESVRVTVQGAKVWKPSEPSTLMVCSLSTPSAISEPVRL